MRKLVQHLSKIPNYLWFIPRQRNNQPNTKSAHSCLIPIMWLCPGVQRFWCTTFPTYVSAKAQRVKNIQCGVASILRGCACIWSGSSEISNPRQLQNTRGRACSQMIGLLWCLSCAFLVEVMEKNLAWLTSKCSSEVKITRMQLRRGAASRTLFVTHGIQTRGFNTVLCSALTAPRVTNRSSIQRSGVMIVCLLLGPDFYHIILWLFGANQICTFLSWLIFLSSNKSLSPSKWLSTVFKQRKHRNYDHLGKQVWLQDA